MSRPPYERPVLIKHQPGLMNKFGRARSLRPLGAIDGVSTQELLDTYGSPLFVFSERTLVDRYHELYDALARRWPRVRLGWSYKTNYLDAVCRVFHREGAWAEVVSGFEYEKAARLGVPPEQVHFNGPYKPEADLARALASGSLVHLDHFDELALAEQIARQRGIRPGVAIRLNMAVQGTPAWSRFGFNLEDGQAMAAARRITASDRLELVGIHCHLGTFVTEPDVYREAAHKMASFANDLRHRLGVSLQFIDLGGGLASPNTLKAQYLPGEQTAPSPAAYAEAITDGLAALDVPAGQEPALVLESGRALVDEAGTLLTTVVANKRMPEGRRGVVVDAGVNLLFTSYWYKHDLVPTTELRGTPEPTIVYGPLCMNIDVVRDTLMFPPVKPGDRLALRNVGAYNVTQWMQFITYRPAVVMVRSSRLAGGGPRHALIRRREDLEVVTGPEELPPWL